MLTEEVLKANESLKDLTAEQIQTIATLSENDENTVIGNPKTMVRNVPASMNLSPFL